ASITESLSGGDFPGYYCTGRRPYSLAEIFSLFAEYNIDLTYSSLISEELSFDHHIFVVINLSPSVILSQGVFVDLT
ncbi:TonB-dependent siderophore receptor, partial [Klebsiella pneumoniae]|nr:TonB-dependent siderophore receptor [Klebsiella pneumoniae]